MIRFRVVPLRPEGAILLPVDGALEVVSGACHIDQALVDACAKRGWAVHHRSARLARCVASERPPLKVLRTERRGLLAVWRVS